MGTGLIILLMVIMFNYMSKYIKKGGYGLYWLGKKRGPQSESHKKNASESHKKNPSKYWLGKERPEFGQLMKESNTGKIGELHPRYISDRTKLKKTEKRWNTAYKEWWSQCKKRDIWKCKINNTDCNGVLEVHHILDWKNYPELRYKINNGITLCHFHHPRGREKEKLLSPYFKELISENTHGQH